jgi:hypothetical protein
MRNTDRSKESIFERVFLRFRVCEQVMPKHAAPQIWIFCISSTHADACLSVPQCLISSSDAILMHGVEQIQCFLLNVVFQNGTLWCGRVAVQKRRRLTSL